MDDRSIKKHSLEISLLHWFCGLFFVLTATGLFTWFIDAVPPLIEQALSIVHLCAGLGVSLVFFYYSVHHFRRTISFRRVLSILLGSLVFIVFLYVLISGVTLFYQGVLTKNEWLYESHVWVSFLVIFFLTTHILVHYFTFPKRRLRAIPRRFVTLSSKVVRTVLIFFLLSGAGVLSLIVIDYYFSSESVVAEPSLHKDYLYSYGEGLKACEFTISPIEVYYEATFSLNLLLIEINYAWKPEPMVLRERSDNSCM